MERLRIKRMGNKKSEKWNGWKLELNEWRNGTDEKSNVKEWNEGEMKQGENETM